MRKKDCLGNPQGTLTLKKKTDTNLALEGWTRDIGVMWKPSQKKKEKWTRFLHVALHIKWGSDWNVSMQENYGQVVGDHSESAFSGRQRSKSPNSMDCSLNARWRHGNAEYRHNVCSAWLWREKQSQDTTWRRDYSLSTVCFCLCFQFGLIKLVSVWEKTLSLVKC